MADFLGMRPFLWSAAWRAAYTRTVRSSFATVPFYREHWALRGRTDPVVVPGREGDGGAVPAEAVTGRLRDLVPLAGGPVAVDPLRGLGPVLARCARPRPGALVVVLDETRPRPPADLPRGVRGWVLDPDVLAVDDAAAPAAELTTALRRGNQVLAVGADKDMATLAAMLPGELAHRLDRLPRRELDELEGSGPTGILTGGPLGVLGGLWDCGRWHLDWPRVYARSTPGGLAFSLLRQRSPRLVDLLPAGGVRGRIEHCPRHGSPVIET